MLLAVVGVLYLSYIFSKNLSARAAKINGAEYLKVVDRLPVGQDRFILIIELQGKYILVSVTAQNITVLKELDDFSELPASEGEQKSFAESLKAVLQNMYPNKK